MSQSNEPLNSEDLERVAEHYRKGHPDGSYIRGDIERLLATVQAAEERAEALRAALEFYASRQTYEEREREYRDIDGNPRRSYIQPIENDDYGSLAREALAADDAKRGES